MRHGGRKFFPWMLTAGLAVLLILGIVWLRNADPIPTYPQAHNITEHPLEYPDSGTKIQWLQSFETHTPPPEVLAWYDQRLGAQGWTQLEPAVRYGLEEVRPTLKHTPAVIYKLTTARYPTYAGISIEYVVGADSYRYWVFHIAPRGLLR